MVDSAIEIASANGGFLTLLAVAAESWPYSDCKAVVMSHQTGSLTRIVKSPSLPSVAHVELVALTAGASDGTGLSPRTGIARCRRPRSIHRPPRTERGWHRGPGRGRRPGPPSTSHVNPGAPEIPRGLAEVAGGCAAHLIDLRPDSDAGTCS